MEFLLQQPRGTKTIPILYLWKMKRRINTLIHQAHDEARSLWLIPRGHVIGETSVNKRDAHETLFPALILYHRCLEVLSSRSPPELPVWHSLVLGDGGPLTFYSCMLSPPSLHSLVFLSRLALLDLPFPSEGVITDSDSYI